VPVSVRATQRKRRKCAGLLHDYLPRANPETSQARETQIMNRTGTQHPTMRCMKCAADAPFRRVKGYTHWHNTCLVCGTAYRALPVTERERSPKQPNAATKCVLCGERLDEHMRGTLRCWRGSEQVFAAAAKYAGIERQRA
jgi:hypothetical protein